MNDFAILMPSFNDNESTNLLVEKLMAAEERPSLNIIVIDDASESPILERQFSSHKLVHVLRLEENVGHQLAIAKGIKFALNHFENLNWIVIMDSDGEDGPEDAIKLLNQARHKGKTVVAIRGRRFVNLGFRIGYFLYRSLLKVLTGHSINFGNFGAYKSSDLKRMIARGYLSTHFPASLIEASIDFTGIKIDRQPRFFGSSKMSTKGLMLHGLAGVSVLWASIVRRSLVLAVLLSCGLVCGILLALFLYISDSPWLIPGWTSTMLALGIILLTQIWASWIILVLVLYRIKPA